MNDIEFCQRILENCQQQHWYGPDIYLPSKIQNEFQGNSTMYWYDRNHKQYPINRHTNVLKIPTSRTFEYSPLTEEQVRFAEKRLGFSLPPLLRAIYMYVADGGFGPGYGLFHLLGEGESIVDSYLTLKRRGRLMDFQLFERRASQKKLIMIPTYISPDGFLCLCDWGCAIYSYLDIRTGRVLREAYYGDDKYGFIVEAPSLEAWFELWLAKGIGMFDLSYQHS